jgi:hypothetical protein
VNPKLNQCVTVTRVSSSAEPFESCLQVAVFSVRYCDIVGNACVSGVAECFSHPKERFLDIFSDPFSIAD